MDDSEKRFNLAVPELQEIIAKRKHMWRATSVMEWADVSNILLERIYRQFHHYDPSQPLDRWVNTVISNAIKNMVRNLIVKTNRPCVSATPYGANCSFNLGCNKCSWTKSGNQDSSCKFYAKWEKRKQAKFSISTPLSIEHHINESHSMPDELLSEERVEAAKKTIDDNIQRRLTKEEYRIYVLLYVKHLSLKEAAKKMGFKGDNETKSYLRVRSASIKIQEIAGQLISENGVFR